MLRRSTAASFASGTVTSRRCHRILFPACCGVRSMAGRRSECPGVTSECPSLCVIWRVPSEIICCRRARVCVWSSRLVSTVGLELSPRCPERTLLKWGDAGAGEVFHFSYASWSCNGWCSRGGPCRLAIAGEESQIPCSAARAIAFLA